MSKRTSGSELIRAAGGLLWRPVQAGARASSRAAHEIAVIRRLKYHDWTLPKGKLDPGEHWQTAALREVREETGFQAKLMGFAGAVTYQTNNGPKVVRYWHMVPLGPQGRIENEVAELLWLPIEQARVRLDYDLERAVLEAWDGPEIPATM